MTRIRESHGPRWSKVGLGISLERIEFSTERMAERGTAKRSSSSAMSCVATEIRQIYLPCKAMLKEEECRCGSEKGGAVGDYPVAGCELTDAASSLNVTQVFQLDLGADHGARAFQPVQKDMTGLVERVHERRRGMHCGSGESDQEET